MGGAGGGGVVKFGYWRRLTLLFLLNVNGTRTHRQEERPLLPST